MSFLKKIWQNRQSEHPSRRILTNVNTNDIMMVEVARSEGEVLAEGDAFDESNMNDLEERIENAFSDDQDSINSISSRVSKTELQLNDFSFGVTSDGKAGYKRGASSEIIPFKTTEVYYLGEGTMFDIRSKFPKNYQKFTIDNFIVSCNYSGSSAMYDGTENFSKSSNVKIPPIAPTKSYLNGILTIGNTSGQWWFNNFSDNHKFGGMVNAVNIKVYLLIGEIKNI